MLNLAVNNYFLNSENNSLIEKRNIREKVLLSIIRDLLRIGWNVSANDSSIQITPPENYNKDTVKNAMSIRRNELIDKNKKWIEDHIQLGRNNLIDGSDLLASTIIPEIFECKTTEEHNLFRLFRYYWSSPYSDYVGRRVRLLIRDMALPQKPIIGIAALGSSIIHIPERDEWIGWDKETRTKNIINTMDAYVIGALPPYNYILGGKLISYILTSNEVRDLYKQKYKNHITLKQRRKRSDLGVIFTTSLYGKSSQYNRLKYNNRLLYKLIGNTKGFGTLHLSEETFQAMLELLQHNNINVTHKFGDGPSWRMRVIRTVGDLLGFDSNILLQHSFKRNIYGIPLCVNFRAYLNGTSKKPRYYNLPMKKIVDFWKNRWYNNRIMNEKVLSDVIAFRKEDFKI